MYDIRLRGGGFTFLKFEMPILLNKLLIEVYSDALSEVVLVW